jgi:hypothetical protein
MRIQPPQLHRRPADLPLFPGDESQEEPANPDEDEPKKDDGSSPDELWPPGDEPEEVIDDDPEPR